MPPKIIHYTTLDSTNAQAKRLLDEGAITGLTAIVADAQTAGRGTQGRAWISPPGAGLYLSIVHPHPPRLLSTPLYTLAAGVACAEVLTAISGLEIRLKPVNDLYLAGGKLGGILTESLFQGDQCRGLITGIGINLLDVPRPLAQAIVQPISLEAALSPDAFQALLQGSLPKTFAETLMEQLTCAVDIRYQELHAGEEDKILSAYARYKLPQFAMPM